MVRHVLMAELSVANTDPALPYITVYGHTETPRYLCICLRFTGLRLSLNPNVIGVAIHTINRFKSNLNIINLKTNTLQSLRPTAF